MNRFFGALPGAVPVAAGLLLVLFTLAFGADLPEIKERGTLRHLGVPYAGFVTGSGDGLDVEMVKLFAEHLGVRYEYVQTTWEDMIRDLSGKLVKARGDDFEETGVAVVKGDIAANGITILPWREKIVDFSLPTFPNQIWLVARAESPIQPITPSGDRNKDISAVKARLKGYTIIGILDTCLDPNLYGLSEARANVKGFEGELNELIPAVMNGEGEAAVQDVADAIMATEKWPGKVKVIGPVSPMQNMGYAFAKTSPELRDAFNDFYEQCRRDGTYARLMAKYYPAILKYYPDFFRQQ